jgi:Cu+-exporting ATPase
VRIGQSIAGNHFPEPVRSFLETAGCGMEGTVAGHEIWMGSAAWLQSRGLPARSPEGTTGGTVHVAIDGHYRGCYVLASALRAGAEQLVPALADRYELALLSGDNEKERERFAALFGGRGHIHFNQSPLNKLGFIRDLQQRGHTVMMVGDGLNDAGALQQSDVGVAVVENVGAFSPASDAIMSADQVPHVPEMLSFSRDAVRIVRVSFLISTFYNVIGLSIAASGLLAPIVCAILMPLSSITVVAFACGATGWRGRRRMPVRSNPEPQLAPALQTA